MIIWGEGLGQYPRTALRMPVIRFLLIECVFGRRFADLVATLTPGEQEELRVLSARLLASFVDLHTDEAERTEWASEFGCPGR